MRASGLGVSMADRDYSTGYAATTDDAEIRDGTELVRGDGVPPEWFDGDSLHVDLPNGLRVVFIAMPDRGKDLFSWAAEGEPPKLARLERINGTTMRVHFVHGVP